MGTARAAGYKGPAAAATQTSLGSTNSATQAGSPMLVWTDWIPLGPEVRCLTGSLTFTHNPDKAPGRDRLCHPHVL